MEILLSVFLVQNQIIGQDIMISTIHHHFKSLSKSQKLRFIYLTSITLLCPGLILDIDTMELMKLQSVGGKLCNIPIKN